MTLPTKKCRRTGCSALLTGRNTKYCSNKCRAIEQQAKKRALAESVALDEVRARVGPVVQEALTERVLHEIGVLTELVPEALKVIQDGLAATVDGAPDYAERRQAATLLLKYTVGQQGLAPARETQTQAGLVVNFGLPSNGDAAEGQSVIDADSIEEPTADRECLECHEFKQPAEFVGESSRCQACHTAILERIRAKHPSLLPSGHAPQ